MGWLQPQPYTAAIREIGLWTIRLIFIALAITPLRGVLQWSRLILVRRMIGVAAFAYALTHLSLYTADQMFDLVKVASEIVSRIYLTIGFAAVIGLSALAATSTDGMIRRLGGRNWQRLHRLVYLIALRAVAAGVGRRARGGGGGFDGAGRGGLFLDRVWRRSDARHRRQLVLGHRGAAGGDRARARARRHGGRGGARADCASGKTPAGLRLKPAAGEVVMNEHNALLRELMVVFDELPAPLRDAINYAAEPLDPKSLAKLCRRHGAGNVLAMIEMKLKRAADRRD